MKGSFILGLVLAVSVGASGPVLAQTEAKPKKEFSEKQLAQQQRMRDCSADAKEKGLKGDDRKAFMKTCLSGGRVSAEAGGEAASDKRAAQRDKMTSCNAEAKSQALKGAERKAFMSECLAK
jgi:hypothetical protein